MTLHGIDVSHWQSGLQLAKTDAQFALFKATDGTSYVDPTCDGFVNQAKKLGIPWGVYHFWQGNPTAEADHFVDSVAGYVGHGLLVLDFEGAHAVSASAAKTFLDRVYSRTGVRPLIYMSQSVTRQFDWSAVARDYALWVARYGSSSYGDTGAWKAPAMWQYTDAHKTGGYSVDGDYFYGDRDTWAAFATGGNKPKPAPAPDPTPEPTPEDEMKYKGFATSKKTTALKNGEWTTVHIDDDGAVSCLSTKTGGVLFDALLQLTLDGLPEGRVAQVRFVAFDVDSGVKATSEQTFPITEIIGTDGGTFGQVAQVGKLNKPTAAGPDGRLLRTQVKVFDDGVTVKAASARVLYQD